MGNRISLPVRIGVSTANPDSHSYTTACDRDSLAVDHEDIDHRPAADEFDHLEDFQPGMGLFGRGGASRDHGQPGDGHEFRDRHHDRGHEDDRRQDPEV